jgi:hypothetical protein
MDGATKDRENPAKRVAWRGHVVVYLSKIAYFGF